jgi:hypothetical protein
MGGVSQPRAGLLVAAAGVCLVIAAQLLAGLVPAGAAGVATGAALGEAGFVYLTGFRVTLAGVLWNRVDTQGDTYYDTVPLDHKNYVLPTARVVTWLDPQYTEPYFVAQWVIARSGHPAEALRMTREGLVNNPDSGLLRYSYAQLLDVFYKHDRRAYVWALKIIAPDAKWRSTDEKFEGWAIAREIFKRRGDTTLYEETLKELAYLKTPTSKLAPSEQSVTGR